MAIPEWLTWARRIQALAQSGLTYANNEFDRERYHELRTIAAEMMAQGGNTDVRHVEALFAQQHGYMTPQVGVRAIVFDAQHRLLMVREKADGGWTPPGGWCDVGSTPSEVAVREVREETGLQVTITRLIAVLDRDKQGHTPIPWHVYIIFFLCEVVGGELQASHEVSEVGWFGQDHIPPLSLDRVVPGEIELFFAYHADPRREPTFD